VACIPRIAPTARAARICRHQHHDAKVNHRLRTVVRPSRRQIAGRVDPVYVLACIDNYVIVSLSPPNPELGGRVTSRTPELGASRGRSLVRTTRDTSAWPRRP
jgi:hypothetical protein